MRKQSKVMRKQSKVYAAGGKVKTKTHPDGYKYKKGGKLEMVEKDGAKVPFFAADGKGKMMAGGMVPKSKGYFKGGRVMSKMNTKGGKKGGKG